MMMATARDGGGNEGQSGKDAPRSALVEMGDGKECRSSKILEPAATMIRNPEMTKKTSTPRYSRPVSKPSGVEEYDGHDRPRAQAVNVPPVAKPRRRGSTRLLRPRLLHRVRVRSPSPLGGAGRCRRPDAKTAMGTQRRSRAPSRLGPGHPRFAELRYRGHPLPRSPRVIISATVPREEPRGVASIGPLAQDRPDPGASPLSAMRPLPRPRKPGECLSRRLTVPRYARPTTAKRAGI